MIVMRQNKDSILRHLQRENLIEIEIYDEKVGQFPLEFLLDLKEKRKTEHSIFDSTSILILFSLYPKVSWLAKHD